MDAETVKAKMMAQVEQAQQSAMAGPLCWAFEVLDMVIYVSMQHRQRPEHGFLLSVSFDDFPRRAPSYVFVDQQTRQVTDESWPPNVRHGAQPPGICTPGTREFHEHFHANDAGYPWDPERYTVLDTLHRIHQLMERGIEA